MSIQVMIITSKAACNKLKKRINKLRFNNIIRMECEIVLNLFEITLIALEKIENEK